MYIRSLGKSLIVSWTNHKAVDKKQSRISYSGWILLTLCCSLNLRQWQSRRPSQYYSYVWVTFVDHLLQKFSVFRKFANDQNISDNWRIDSAVTSTYEIENPPDYQGQNCMHGIPMSHVAWQVTTGDFPTFAYMLCMDENNLRDLSNKGNRVKNCEAKIEPFGSYGPQKQLIIEDPYYGNDSNFETVYLQCIRCCKAFFGEVTVKPHPFIDEGQRD